VERDGLCGTQAVQVHCVRRVHAFLRGRGKTVGGWEEVAQGGRIPAEGSLLFA
jgi:hexosaminidase